MAEMMVDYLELKLVDSMEPYLVDNLADLMDDQ